VVAENGHDAVGTAQRRHQRLQGGDDVAHRRAPARAIIAGHDAQIGIDGRRDLDDAFRQAGEQSEMRIGDVQQAVAVERGGQRWKSQLDLLDADVERVAHAAPVEARSSQAKRRDVAEPVGNQSRLRRDG